MMRLFRMVAQYIHGAESPYLILADWSERVLLPSQPGMTLLPIPDVCAHSGGLTSYRAIALTSR